MTTFLQEKKDSMMCEPRMVSFHDLCDYHCYSEEEMLRRANTFFSQLAKRRTVRNFSDKRVPENVIDQCILSAGTAPNGANLQPWHFAVVSSDTVKRAIRVAAEEEELAFYSGRAPQDWLDALAPLGTNADKPFLETASHLIVVFSQTHGLDDAGNVVKHYYPLESVGLATGFLISALHYCGLVTLTHTPSPMKFLNKILARPANERPFVLLVVGYPAENATVPAIEKKTLQQIVSRH